MDINNLIANVKKKLNSEITIESVEVEDKSFLHKNHSGHQRGKYHLKLIINSKELRKLSKLESSKKIYKILDEEIKKNIHSLQILIS
tara:strand:+ start:672 stop:932 length:261 start_codon:yes stop_codon:yes gene_type:complete